MLKWIETTGRSEEDAITAALFQLGLDRDDVSVEVIERAKSGFLGFGSNPAKVRVSYEEVDGVARPISDGISAEGDEPKTQNAVPVSGPVQEETVLPAPRQKAKAEPPVPKPSPVEEQTPAAPAAVETILAAKPGMAPVKKSQPRPERREHCPGPVADGGTHQDRNHRFLAQTGPVCDGRGNEQGGGGVCPAPQSELPGLSHGQLLRCKPDHRQAHERA